MTRTQRVPGDGSADTQRGADGCRAAPGGDSDRDRSPIVLVDENDRAVGVGGKLDVHRSGLLHRGFSVLLYDVRGRQLLQRRAAGKYHFAGCWSNACCSHPRPGESTLSAANRRLHEELGIAATLTPKTELCYRAEDPETGLIEHEYLHVFTGLFSGSPTPDASEVGAWRWMAPTTLERAMQRAPALFTPWFMTIIGRLGRC